MTRKKKELETEADGPKAGDDLEDHAQTLVRTRQGRVDDDGGATAAQAMDTYNKMAGDYAVKAQSWKDAQKLRVVREDDLVKVHTHKPFDDKAAGRVARELAKSIQNEKAALQAKQESKKSLGTQWDMVRSFMGEKSPVQPLIPDEEGDEDEREM